jgi:hypothetical protein
MSLDGFLELKFAQSDPENLTITNLARSQNTLKAPFPYQKWIYIEL